MQVNWVKQVMQVIWVILGNGIERVMEVSWVKQVMQVIWVILGNGIEPDNAGKLGNTR